MNVSQWNDFFNGRGQDIVIAGRLDDSMCSLMGVLDRRVYLDRYYVSKFVEKHGLEAADMCNLTSAIHLGRIVRESEGRVSMFYMDVTGSKKLYKAAIKVVKSDRKMYVSTFHRSDLKQLRRISTNGFIWRKEKRIRDEHKARP